MGIFTYIILLGTALAFDAKAQFVPSYFKTQAIEQWEQLKYGAFIHYNMNTYGPLDNLDDFYRGDCKNPDLFHPTHLDIAGWIKSFKDAGMKYAVLTTRHIGGFLLWNSKTSHYSSLYSQFVKKDIVREFVDECRKQGIVPGLYYLMGGGYYDTSSCPINGKKFGKKEVITQLTELTTKYGEIPYFWIDMMDWRPILALGDTEEITVQEIYDLIKINQPRALIIFNQHVGSGNDLHYFPTDIINGEETVPPVDGYFPWKNLLTHFHFDEHSRQTDDDLTYIPNTFYLPFEFTMPVQLRPKARIWTQNWFLHHALWFTRSSTRIAEAINMFAYVKLAFERGASNVLIAAAPDESGSMRTEDVAQLKILGDLIHSHH